MYGVTIRINAVTELRQLEFFIDIKSFRSHYGPGVDSASNLNKYQGGFPWGKGGQCVRLTTLPPSCAVVTKSGNLKFLEPSGPLQACNGTDLPLPYWSTPSVICTYISFSTLATWPPRGHGVFLSVPTKLGCLHKILQIQNWIRR